MNGEEKAEKVENAPERAVLSAVLIAGRCGFNAGSMIEPNKGRTEINF